jgi:hypothetical protein
VLVRFGLLKEFILENLKINFSMKEDCMNYKKMELKNFFKQKAMKLKNK